MTPTSRTLLICVTFLCGLEEALLLSVAQRGFCARNRCFALFEEPVDFQGAQKRCKDTDGELLASNAVSEDLPALLGELRGVFWLAQSAEEKAAGLHNCSSFSAEHDVVPVPCSKQMDGFLCQYAVYEPCRSFQASRGARVTYTTPMGFEVIFTKTFTPELATFPPGTIGIAQLDGDKYPQSKHLCFSTKWMRAPWNCEVMGGGCEHGCSSASCVCPAGQTVHPNNSFTCAEDQCAECAQLCAKEGDTRVCSCHEGYRLARDGKSCVDVDECAEESPCSNEGEECVNTEGGFKCRCAEDFVEEDGACVDIRICLKCEHMLCNKYDGVYRCDCNKGYRSTAKDPTKCELYCGEKDCPPSCIYNPDQEQEDLRYTCYCPEGYILDTRNGTNICSDINECADEQQCEHTCENLFGSYRCSCDEGYELFDEYMCVSPDEENSTPPQAMPASAKPAVVPPYVKTGSILGITLFMALTAALLFFLIRNMAKRCGRLELTSIKGPDMDIFYLQQVTTETYKKLSFDKQFKNDP